MGILYIVLGAAYLVNPKGVLRWAKVSDNPSTAFVLFSRLIGLWGILEGLFLLGVRLDLWLPILRYILIG